MCLIYLLGAIVCCFFSWKKWGKAVKNREDYKMFIDVPEFWYVCLITVLYPISVPIYAFWHLLELIYNKFKKEDEIN